jgi:hypothetical protein
MITSGYFPLERIVGYCSSESKQLIKYFIGLLSWFHLWPTVLCLPQTVYFGCLFLMLGSVGCLHFQISDHQKYLWNKKLFEAIAICVTIVSDSMIACVCHFYNSHVSMSFCYLIPGNGVLCRGLTASCELLFKWF